jgi:hypothetical protein
MRQSTKEQPEDFTCELLIVTYKGPCKSKDGTDFRRAFQSVTGEGKVCSLLSQYC